MSREWGLGLLATTLLVGCGSKFNDFCELKNQCERGNDKDKSACVIDLENDKQLADNYGCGDKVDDYWKLYYEEREGAWGCVDGEYQADTTEAEAVQISAAYADIWQCVDSESAIDFDGD